MIDSAFCCIRDAFRVIIEWPLSQEQAPRSTRGTLLTFY